MKLSKTSCGFDIVMDGINQKLPYDMKEHSCAAFQKRIPGSGNREETRAIMCSPTDSADNPNTDPEYKDRACWRFDLKLGVSLNNIENFLHYKRVFY